MSPLFCAKASAISLGVFKGNQQMHKRTVKTGLNLILAGLVSATLAAFYHHYIGRILDVSGRGETIFIIIGLLLGIIVICLGILFASVGIIKKTKDKEDIRLSNTIILLAAALAIFLFLFYMSLPSTENPGLDPGRTITI